MALSIDQVKGAGITDDALITKIVQLSAADETAIRETEKTAQISIADKRVNKAFSDVEETIATVTGVKKNDNEKASDFVTRAIPEFLSKKSATVIEERDSWKNKFETHKGDETLKAELKTASEKIADFPNVIARKQQEFDQAVAAKTKELHEFQITQGFAQALPPIDPNANKFEAEARMKLAMDAIKNGGYEFTFNEAGEMIATKDYQPFKVKDLILSNENIKAIIAKQPAGGGGSPTPAGTGGAGSGAESLKLPFSIPENTSKGDAQELIRIHILDTEKMPTLDPGYSKRFKDLCAEYKVL